MSLLLIIIIIIALLFEFINGFHDVANVVFTTIATKSLSPYQAILLAVIFNFIGAFIGTSVISTLTKGLIDENIITYLLLISSLLSAIYWNLFTWFCKIPSSSSHALIGSLIGATLASSNINKIFYSKICTKVVCPMILSPIIAFFLTLCLMIIFFNILKKNQYPRKSNACIRELQVLSSSLLALGHGSNDAQKTMSIITLSLLNFGIINNLSHIPIWVILLSGLTMALGTLLGGMRIIKMITSKFSKMPPINGFAAEMSSGILILFASYMGLPISTTQAASGSIMGAYYAQSRYMDWHLIRNIIMAWILTLPLCILLSYIIYKILFFLFQ